MPNRTGTRSEPASPLTPARFRVWLRGQEPETIVGVPAASGMCPLATYLHEHGLPDAQVVMPRWRPQRYGYTDGASWPSLPSWACLFGVLVDTIYDDVGEVTAAQALAILDAARPEVR